MNPKTPPFTTTKFNREAVEAIYEGVKEVCEATATTLGPMGRNVLIDKGYEIAILHDGVSVANSINPEEPFKNKGAKVIQEAAKKQRDEVGDGTTAVMVLTKAILDKALEVTSSGVNPMLFTRGLESGAKKVIHKIIELSTPVKTLEQKIQIATISAEDPDLGKLIAETIHKIGDQGILTVDESKAQETVVELQEGMQIEKGFAHEFMITDIDRRTAVLEDAEVIVTDLPLTDLTTIGNFLDSKVFPNSKKVLFISPEIGGDFMTAMLGAKIRGQFLGLCVRAPGLGWMQREILQDIAALTGATFITKEAGHKFEDFDFSALGHVSRVVSSQISTIIEGGVGHKEAVLQRIQVIKAQMEDTSLGEYDREQLRGRLGKLTNGVAVIKVGGQTEIEMKERKERAIDAVASTQAAVEHGLVPGGEIIYLNVLDELDENILGEKILKEALKEPFRRLVSNAGYDPGEMLARLEQNVLIKKWVFSRNSGLTNEDVSKIDMDDPAQYILVSGDPSKAISYVKGEIKNCGFDVTDGEFKDMIAVGIIDPTSVPVTAIKTAVSVASKLSSLGAAVVQDNSKDGK